MTEQAPIQNITKDEGSKIQVQSQTNKSLASYLQRIINVMPMPVKNYLNKFYSNKKIFLPITIAIGLLILVILAGLIFGNKTASKKIIIKTTPTPGASFTATPQATQSGDTIGALENSLKSLKSKGDSWDIRQNKFQPPEMEFDISP